MRSFFFFSSILLFASGRVRSSARTALSDILLQSASTPLVRSLFDNVCPTLGVTCRLLASVGEVSTSADADSMADWEGLFSLFSWDNGEDSVTLSVERFSEEATALLPLLAPGVIVVVLSDNLSFIFPFPFVLSYDVRIQFFFRHEYFW